MALAPPVAFTVTFAVVRYLVHSPRVLRVLDQPNERSLHMKAIPRTGGLGIMSGIFVSWALFSRDVPVVIWTSVLLLTLISFADDVFNLPAWVRFILHAAIASWLSAEMLSDMHGWIATAIAA